MPKNKIRELTMGAMLGAIYAVLTIVLPIPQYAGVQVRLAEALVVLPFLYPRTTSGLFVGCVIANLLSPYGPLDVVAGSAATLLACLWTGRMKHRKLAWIPPTLCNALIVGAVIAFAQTGFGPAFGAAYLLNALSVGVGECLACGVLGSMLLRYLPRLSAFRKMIPEERMKYIET